MFLQAIESRGVNFPFHLTVDCKDKMHQRRQQISLSANRKATILGKYVSVCQPWLWKCLSHFLLSADEPETTYDFSKCCQKQTVTAQQPKTPGFNICLWACTDHWNRLRAHQDICGTFSTFILPDETASGSWVILLTRPHQSVSMMRTCFWGWHSCKPDSAQSMGI